MNMKPIRTAFILGAGMGMRLRPLTENRPKPLLPVGGRPLITWAMDHCLAAGIERFIVNTHHCAAAYDEAFPNGNWRGTPILFRYEPLLLDTAGGLKNIEELLEENETIIVYNGDILSDLPIGELLDAHAAGGKEVTLALRCDGRPRSVCLDDKGAVCDLRDTLGNSGLRRCLFTGIYAVEKRFLRRLTPGKVESVVPVLVEMIREAPGSVGGVVIDQGSWMDIGDTETYERISATSPAISYEKEDGNLRKMADRRFASRTSDPPVVPLPGNGSPAFSTLDGGEREHAAAFVRSTLGLPPDAGLAFVPAGRGGSDRGYFRVTPPGRPPAILMRYDRSREENHYYAPIAGFLRDIGIPVPALFGSYPERGLILLEDLGDKDLFSFCGTPREVRRRLYEKTLEVSARLHAFPLERFPADAVRLMPGFGPELYRWERDYFRQECVRGVFGIDLGGATGEALETELAALAGRLLETPASLIHRDLQSQNVMIRNGEPFFIDFQGMRRGSPFYDLASLLQDPYVDMPEEEQAALLRYYHGLSRPAYGGEEFRQLFLLASAQRLMQALGAYGYLGLKRGKPRFLAHIPCALDRLIAVTGRANLAPRLHALARRCRSVLSDGSR